MAVPTWRAAFAFLHSLCRGPLLRVILNRHRFSASCGAAARTSGPDGGQSCQLKLKGPGCQNTSPQTLLGRARFLICADSSSG